VILSPHTAGHSQGQQEAVLEIFLDNLQRRCADRPLNGDVDELG
jgi:phosphoglycerate dehydrogenase-like enzyme